MELFQMVLNGTVSWAVGKALDVAVFCPRCDQHDKKRIANVRPNHIECTNCHQVTEQYTNACDYTVDLSNGTVGHVMLASGAGDIRADRNFGGKIRGFKVPISLETRNLENRGLVVDLSLGRFGYGGEEYTSQLVQPIFDASVEEMSAFYNANTIFRLLGGNRRPRRGAINRFLAGDYELRRETRSEPLEIGIEIRSNSYETLYSSNILVQLNQADINSLNRATW